MGAPKKHKIFQTRKRSKYNFMRLAAKDSPSTLDVRPHTGLDVSPHDHDLLSSGCTLSDIERIQGLVSAYQSETPNIVEMAVERLPSILMLCMEGHRNRSMAPSLCDRIDPVHVQSGNSVQSGLCRMTHGPCTTHENLACETGKNVCSPNLFGPFGG